MTALRNENHNRCVPPLGDAEIKRIVDSISGRAALDNPNDLTEAGNARRFAAQHSDKIRYCHGWKKWLLWDGSRWRRDEDGEAMRLAKNTATSIYTDIAQYSDSEVRKNVAKHASKSESDYSLNAMLRLAQTEVGISAKPADFNKDPWLLNVQNGTVNLKTGRLEPARKEQLITKLAPVEFSKDARCPEWEKFLSHVMAKNREMIRFLQQAIGYSLTGSVREQKLFFFYGTGANGKSTFLNIIQEMLGDYSKQAAPELLVAKIGNTHPTEIADLQGSRFVVAVEVDEGKRLAEALIKQMTGGDRINARFMHQDFFEFEPTHKLFLAANHMPLIHGTDYGIWRRIMLVPFTVTIPEKEQDKELISKLREEMPGILAWAVKGCLDWQKSGLQPPARVERATTSYQSEMDVMGKFLEEQCSAEANDPGKQVKASTLFEAFTKWSMSNGDQQRLTRQDFSMRLRGRGFKTKRHGDGYRWLGISLRRPSLKEDKAA